MRSAERGARRCGPGAEPGQDCSRIAEAALSFIEGETIVIVAEEVPKGQEIRFHVRGKHLLSQGLEHLTRHERSQVLDGGQAGARITTSELDRTSQTPNNVLERLHHPGWTPGDKGMPPNSGTVLLVSSSGGNILLPGFRT